MPALDRVEVWSDVQCAAGAVCLAHVPGITGLTETVDVVTGERTVTLTAAGDSRAAPQLIEDRVLRLRMNSTDVGYQCVERRISKIARSHSSSGLLTTATARAIRQDLGVRALITRRTPTGRAEQTFAMPGLSLADHVNAFILPALFRLGYTWWRLGRIQGSQVLSSFVYDNDTPLSALLRLATAAGLELDTPPVFDNTLNVGVGYAIEFLTSVGADMPIIHARTGKQLASLSVETSVEDQATVISAIGATASDGAVATMAGARWTATVVDPVSGSVTLADPSAGAGPVGFDDQLNDLALTWLGNDLPRRVLASMAATQSVIIDDARDLAPGTTVWFEVFYPRLTGIDLMVNGNGDTGTVGVQAPGWTAYAPTGSSALVPATDNPFSGTRSLKMTNATAKESVDYQSRTVVAGQVFEIVGYVAADVDMVAPAAALEVWSAGSAFDVTVLATNAAHQLSFAGVSRFLGIDPGQAGYLFIRAIVRCEGAGTLNYGVAIGYNTHVSGNAWFGRVQLYECRDEFGDVTELSHPIYRAQYGSRVAVLSRPEIPDTQNLVPNAALSGWHPFIHPSAPDGVAPDGWILAGPPGAVATVRKNTDPAYWKSGGASVLVTVTADSYIETAPIPWLATVDQPYLSTLVQLFLVSGIVTAELCLDGAPTQGPAAAFIYPQDAGEPQVVTDPISDWFTLATAGLNLLDNNLGWLRLRIRAMTDAVFYLDAGQLTATAQGRDFSDGAAPTRLWQACNERLALYAPPAVSIGSGYLDLETAGGGVLQRDVLQPGQRMELIDPVLGDTVTTRVLGWTRDWFRRVNVNLNLSNQPLDISRMLSRQPPPSRPADPPLTARRYVPPPVQPVGVLMQLIEHLSPGFASAAMIVVVVPNATVPRYRLYRKKSGWPTTTGLPGGPLDPNYFVAERSVVPDGGGTLANGAPCTGGRGDPWAYHLTGDATPSRDPNVSAGWAIGELCCVIVVPLDQQGATGPRVVASHTVIGGYVTPHLRYTNFDTPQFLPANLGFSWSESGDYPNATTIIVEESIDGAPWGALSRSALISTVERVSGRGAPWLPGDPTARPVTWRWRIRALDPSGALIGAIATDPVVLRAVRAGVT